MPDDALIQVKPYLDEIANRLWSNNAAVMSSNIAISRAQANGNDAGFRLYDKISTDSHKKKEDHQSAQY